MKAIPYLLKSENIYESNMYEINAFIKIIRGTSF